MSATPRKNTLQDSTLAALLREKPKRGRPQRSIPRQTVYVALSDDQKELLGRLATSLPPTFERADVPDLAVMVLTARVDALRRAVSDRSAEVPEGVTDLKALYYLWDLPMMIEEARLRWTSIRLGPAQVVAFGRLQGMFNALFGSNRSQVFGLAIAAFERCIRHDLPEAGTLPDDFETFETILAQIYL